MSDYGTIHTDLVNALRAAWDYCDQPPPDDKPDASRGYYGNLPEVLRDALETLAVEKGDSEMLVVHRPGSWEADHVRRLAAGADYR